MVASVAAAMTEEQADEILFDATACMRAWFTTVGILDPLIVWRSNRIMLSYYRNEEKQTAQVRTIAKLQGKLQEILAQPESLARQNCDELLALLKSDAHDAAYTLTLYKGGSDITSEMLVKAYAEDLRNYRGSSNAGPSCMNHTLKYSLRHKDSNGNDTYPCMAYNHPSLALAVLTDADGDVVGRSIISLKHNQFYSVYTADSDLSPVMTTKLQQHNFKQDGDGLKDCFLTTIVNRDGVPLMPYLDGNHDHADFPSDPDDLEEGEEVAITYSSGFCCNHSTGTPENYDSGVTCEECNERLRAEDVTCIDDSCYCEDCVNRHYTYAYIGRHQEYVRTDSEALYYYNDELYTSDGLEYHDLGVTDDGDVYSNDELVFTDSGVYHVDDCTPCAVTGEAFPKCDMVKVCGLMLSPEAVKTHTTNGILNAIRDFVYCNGEPVADDADAIIEAICHADYDYSNHQTAAVHDAMLLQYQTDCELYRITQQLQLFAA